MTRQKLLHVCKPGFNIRKSISVTFHIKRPEKKNHKIVSIDTHTKMFDNMKHAFMRKTLKS